MMGLASRLAAACGMATAAPAAGSASPAGVGHSAHPAPGKGSGMGGAAAPTAPPMPAQQQGGAYMYANGAPAPAAGYAAHAQQPQHGYAQQYPPPACAAAPPAAAFYPGHAYGQPPGPYTSTAAPGGAAAAPAAPAAPRGAGAEPAIRQGVVSRLQRIVQVNGLQRFYPPQQLQAVARRAAAIDFPTLAARWRMPLELALDFASLALYDIIIYCDDSGSMAFEDGGERIDDLKVILGRVAEVSTLFDDDGILVRFMNSPLEGNGIRSAQDAAALLGQVRFGGTTPLAGSMRSRVLEPVVYPLAARGQLAKPVLVITITDGEPTDTPRDAILQVVREARARLSPQYGPKAVAFQFAQVGRDARAQAFLGKLDRDPSVGDVIDCTSYFEQEAEEYARKGVQLSVEAWLLKLMVGAVDPSYDAEDEG